MTNKLKLTILLFVLSSGCAQKLEVPTFVEFCSTIPVLYLPVRYDCITSPNDADYSMLDSVWLNRKIRKGDCCLVGRIWPEKEFIVLAVHAVDDNNSPYLYTYDKNGNTIDSICLVGSCYDCPDGTILRYGSIIENDTSIIVADTTHSYRLDKHDNVIPNSEVVTVDKAVYSLLSTGKFVCINKSKEKM
jgi:hypothetical protein